MKRVAIIVVVAVLLLGYWFWRSRDQQVIKRQCKALIEMADQVDGGVGIFDVKRLEGLLADSILFEIDAVGPDAMQVNEIDVISAYQWLGGNAQKADFKITEFVSITIEKDRAFVKAKVDGILEMPDMRMLEGSHSCDFTWEKSGKGDWLLIGFVFR